MKGPPFRVWDGSPFLFTFFHITGIDPSLAIRITPSVFCHYDDLRTPSLERRQECCVRKQVNGNMTLSEESIILMTPYRLPHHGNRSFTDATDDVLPSAVILSRGKNVL